VPRRCALLWKKKHGSLAGMDEAIAASKRAARDRVALDPHREERRAPAWALVDLKASRLHSPTSRARSW
jgi:hypothetical protein